MWKKFFSQLNSLRRKSGTSERESFESTLKLLPAAVAIGEAPSGKLVFFNDKVFEVFRHPNIPTETFEDYAKWGARHPDGRPYDVAELPLVRTLRTGEVVSSEEAVITRGDGTTGYIRISSVPIRDADGRITAGVVMTQDVTELKESIKARDEFVSLASHELNTPLTSLKLRTQLMLRSLEKEGWSGVNRERLRDYFESDLRSLDRLAGLVSDMLDISRIAGGTMTIRKRAMDLCVLTREVVEAHGPQFEAAGCQVSFACDRPVKGEWDPLRIGQVIDNLLSNAAKYGSGRPISVKVDVTEGMARLQVEDFGIGIPKKDQERIFNRYERAISADEISGLGLGLYITRQIVQMHGGSVTVESEPGKGATFIVSLPIGPKPAP